MLSRRDLIGRQRLTPGLGVGDELKHVSEPMSCRIARRWGDDSRRVKRPQQGLLLLGVLRLVALVALMLGLVLMLLVLMVGLGVVAVGPRPLALPASRLLFVDA